MRRIALIAPLFLAMGVFASEEKPVERSYTTAPSAPKTQSWDQANAKSEGCVSCHTSTDRHTMHASPAVVLGCTDCHGGDAAIKAPASVDFHVRSARHYGDKAHDDHGDEHAFGTHSPFDPLYQSAMDSAHVLPRYPTAPWDWAGVTPDFLLPESVVSVEGTEWLEKAAYKVSAL